MPFPIQWIPLPQPLLCFPHPGRELKNAVEVTPCYLATFKSQTRFSEVISCPLMGAPQNRTFYFPSLSSGSLWGKAQLSMFSLSQGIWRDRLRAGTCAISHRMSISGDAAATLMPYAFLFRDTCLHSVRQEKNYFHSRMGNHRMFADRQWGSGNILWKHLTIHTVRTCTTVQIHAVSSLLCKHHICKSLSHRNQIL